MVCQMYVHILVGFLWFYSLQVNAADQGGIPLVVGTWDSAEFQTAVQTAWNSLANGESRMSALVSGLSTCEHLQCDHTVGWGGSPDENAETTLDALVMDGVRHEAGAVAQLRRVRDAARVAWSVLNHTRHTLLVGEDGKTIMFDVIKYSTILATKFAVKMGFNETTLSSNHTKDMYKKWKANNCQPNFWQNVVPNAATSCGPYKPAKSFLQKSKNIPLCNKKNHDTLGLIVIDTEGAIATGTSSNGATFKIPGRVGDAPIPGAGAYVDGEAGAAVSTGNGDIMMRFLPSFLAVENMRQNVAPENAAGIAVRHIRKFHPNFFGAVVAANRRGEHGAACSGMPTFRYSVNRTPLPIDKNLLNMGYNSTILVEVDCQL